MAPEHGVRAGSAGAARVVFLVTEVKILIE